MVRYLYDNGYPFHSKLAENINIQIERIEKKRASLIIIDGAVGTGKTTLAIEMSDYINELKGIEKTKLAIKEHPQISLGGKEFSGNFRDCHKLNLPVIIYDEAGDFSKRGSITRFNMMLNRLFETYRGFKILVIICLPNFNVLDGQLFDNQIPRMLIHIEDRNNDYGTFKVYSLSQMNWIRYWYDKLPKGAKHRCYSKSIPNFCGQFLNLPPQREKQLDNLSTYGKKNLLKNTEIEMKGLLTYSQLSQKCNRSQIWIKKQFSEAKIKEKAIIDRKKYFDKGVLDLLYSRIDEVREKHGKRFDDRRK